jgi:hypothetical protein
LVDDQIADFSEPVNVRFARTKIAAFDRVIEKPVNTIAIVLVILGGVNPSLRGDGVRAARGILIAEALYVVTKFAQRRCSRTAGEAGADNNDLKLAAVVRTNEPAVIAVGGPLFIDRPGRNLCLKRTNHSCCAGLMSPSKTETGIDV